MNQSLSKPPSVIVSTLVVGFFSVIWLVSLLRIVMLVPGLVNILVAAQTSVVCASFLGLVFWTRAHVTRYLTGVALALLVIKGAMLSLSSSRNISSFLPLSPYARTLAFCVAIGIAILFWRYMYGGRSRSFYSLGSVERSNDEIVK